MSLRYFTTTFVNPPLHAPAAGASGGNGVYAYSSSPSFPIGTFQSTNYGWM